MSEPAGAPPPPDLQKALDSHDAIALARALPDTELARLKTAEEVLEKKFDREQRTRRTARLASAMVGYVALAGFFANAYQSYSNKKDSEQRALAEAERWKAEFKRAQDADKYRAFFETSALATDTANPDKRLVGYALLKEFVEDPNYTSKALIMLEESLALELRGGTNRPGLDGQQQLAVGAILSALSYSSDCHALAQAARTVERLPRSLRARREAQAAAQAAQEPAVEVDLKELSQVFSLYVKRLLFRAASACTRPKDYREVRLPIATSLIALPALGGGSEGKLRAADAVERLAELLREGCDEDREAGLAASCADMLAGDQRLCAEMRKLPGFAEEQAGCELLEKYAAGLGK